MRIAPITLLTFLLSFPLFSQNNSIDFSQPLTLQQCISYALENNIQIKQSELNSELNKIQYNQSKGNFLPSVNANISRSYNSGRTIDPFTNQFATSTILSDNFSLSGNMTLFSGLQNYNTLLQSNYNYLASKYDLDKMKNDIALNIATVYLQILFNEELLINAQAQTGITKIQVDRVQKMVEAGSLPKGNLFEIQSQLANEELAVVNAQNQLELTYLTLSQLLQTNEPVKIIKPELPSPAAQDVAITASLIFDAAKNNMPQVKSSEYKLKSAEKELKIAYGGLSPRLTISGSYGTGFSGNSKKLSSVSLSGYDTTAITTGGDWVLSPMFDYNYETTPFADQIDQNLNKSIGLFLSIPIFNRLNNHNNIQRSKISLMNAKLSLELTHQQLQKDIQQAHADAIAASKKYAATLKALQAMEESFKYTEQKYNVNLITFFDYSNAKNLLNKTKSDLLQSKYEYVFKLKILDFYMGKPLTL